LGERADYQKDPIVYGLKSASEANILSKDPSASVRVPA
jgi:hypothetical protein